MTPGEFDEVAAFNQIENIGVTPIYRLLIFIATVMVNQYRDEKSKAIEMADIAEFAGLSKESFETDGAEEFVSPEKASAMFRR